MRIPIVNDFCSKRVGSVLRPTDASVNVCFGKAFVSVRTQDVLMEIRGISRGRNEQE